MKEKPDGTILTFGQIFFIKGELNPKIKFVLFERTLKNNRVSYLSVFDSLASFFKYFSFF